MLQQQQQKLQQMYRVEISLEIIEWQTFVFHWSMDYYFQYTRVKLAQK